MQSWVPRALLVLFLLFAFDSSFALENSGRQLSHRGTNAQRLKRGLPPRAPLKRGSRADTAKRSSVSPISFSGKIKVTSAVDQNTIGFLQLTGAQDRYIVGSASTADIFTATLNGQGGTNSVTFTDTDAPASHPFLAGLIFPGVELLTSNSNAAILGDAPVTTAPGSTPQSGGSVSIPGSDYETAIWNYSPSPPTLTPTWVNFDSSTPAISIVWDPIGQTLYLTANPSAVILNHPGSQTVTLEPI